MCGVGAAERENNEGPVGPKRGGASFAMGKMAPILRVEMPHVPLNDELCIHIKLDVSAISGHFCHYLLGNKVMDMVESACFNRAHVL